MEKLKKGVDKTTPIRYNIIIKGKQTDQRKKRGSKMTNYEMKKDIFTNMVANGYHMDENRIEEICKDDFYKVEMIENWRQKFFKYLNEE